MRAAATALFATAMGFVAGPTNAAPDAGTVAPAPPSATQIVSSIQAFYAQMKTFNSDFKQQFVKKVYSKTDTRQGRVFFEKPGKMSWRYSDNGRVVSDGQVLKMYEPDNQQQIVHSLAGTQYPAALSFLTGQGNLGQSFAFRLVQPTQPIPGTWILEGTPMSPGTGYQRVVFYVDAATTQVRKITLIDDQQNRNTFEFLNPVVNVPSPSGEFTFTPPPGTKIVSSVP